ncbi:MAG: R3H domain-containing nucleic acid-binding protein [Candidatus Paceibacterota bacterium]
MNNIEDLTKNIFLMMGFSEDQVKVTIDEEHNKISIMVDDESVRGDKAPIILSSLNHIINQILRKEGKSYHIIDFNYYRKERERLIAELARAAARKASVGKDKIELPPMNAYERRLVHVEISTHPELETESIGKGRERRVIIKQLSF